MGTLTVATVVVFIQNSNTLFGVPVTVPRVEFVGVR
jgi:hypothetical protein